MSAPKENTAVEVADASANISTTTYNADRDVKASPASMRPSAGSSLWRHRFVVIKARLFMLLIITLAVIAVSAITWTVSIKATEDSYEKMSEELRKDATGRAVEALKGLLDMAVHAADGLYKSVQLEVDSFTPDAIITVVRRKLWATFHAFDEIQSVTFASAPAPTMYSVYYRRDGPEAAVVGNVSVFLPTVNGTAGGSDIYGVDLDTGLPLYHGPSMKYCVIGNCPLVMPPNEYIAPGPSLQATPIWQAARRLPVGQFAWVTGIGQVPVPILVRAVPVGLPVTRTFAGVLSVVLRADYLQAFLSSLDVTRVFRARVFMTSGPTHLLLATSHGALVRMPTGMELRPSLLPAEESDDPAVRAIARFVNASLATHAASGTLPLLATVSATTHVAGHGLFYVDSRALDVHGLQLRVFLGVTRQQFRGGLDDAQSRGIGITVGICLGVLLLGSLLLLASTMGVGATIRDQAVQLVQAEAEKGALLSRIESLTNKKMGCAALPPVDLDTPLEKLTRLIHGLSVGTPLWLSDVEQLKALVGTRDLHKPAFLQEIEEDAAAAAVEAAAASTASNGSDSVHKRDVLAAARLGLMGRTHRLDAEMGEWLVATVSHRTPRPASSRSESQSPRAAAGRRSYGSMSSTGDAAAMRWLATPLDSHALASALTLAVPRRAAGPLQRLLSGEEAEGGDEEGSALHVVPNSPRVGEPFVQGLGCWEFDTLALTAASGNVPVVLVGYSALQRLQLLEMFHLNHQRVVNFLHEMDRGMPDNPYHNRSHIADVTASTLHLLLHSGVAQFLQPVDVLGAVCAALVHDYKHPGTNNNFVERRGDDIAITYNDQSVLENFHVAEAHRLMRDHSESRFLEPLSKQDAAVVRRRMIDMVLASDLKRHFAVLDAFKLRCASGRLWDVDDEDDRTLLLNMVLKVADIGHAAKPLPIHLVWADKVQTEFFNQGDAELAEGLSVSPFMDRNNACIPKSQIGFFHFIAAPMFELWVKAFPASAHLMAHACLTAQHPPAPVAGSAGLPRCLSAAAAARHLGVRSRRCGRRPPTP
eukprot:jgi/Mesvir1/4264/Mv22225-RA.2